MFLIARILLTIKILTSISNLFFVGVSNLKEEIFHYLEVRGSESFLARGTLLGDIAAYPWVKNYK